MVAINDGYRIAPWADVIYAADARWWSWHRGVESFKGLKYTVQLEAAIWPGVKVLRTTGNLGLELDPSGLRTGQNGGYQAINLAVHLGARRILLLGYDMQIGPGRRTHWFGDHPNRVKSPYHAFLDCFPHLAEPLRQIGVSVINCSRETALTCFPRLPIAEALA